MTPLEIVKLANTGMLLWEQVGPLVQRAMETGEDVSLDELEAASGKLGSDLDALRVAIQNAKAEGR